MRSSLSVQNIFFVVSSSVPKYFPYSFIVAGHTYGSHSGKNIGLHPKFYNFLSNNYLRSQSTDFIVFTGDIVRHNDQESWDTVTHQLKQLALPYFFVMGNHEVQDMSTIGVKLSKKLFQQKHSLL